MEIGFMESVFRGLYPTHLHMHMSPDFRKRPFN